MGKKFLELGNFKERFDQFTSKSLCSTCCSSHSGLSAVSCSHKCDTGFLYPLDKGLIYVDKPTVYNTNRSPVSILLVRQGSVVPVAGCLTWKSA